MLIPDPRRTPLPNLISHNGIILYQWEFLRARLDEGEGLPWITMDTAYCKLCLYLVCVFFIISYSLLIISDDWALQQHLCLKFTSFTHGIAGNAVGR